MECLIKVNRSWEEGGRWRKIRGRINPKSRNCVYTSRLKRFRDESENSFSLQRERGRRERRTEEEKLRHCFIELYIHINLKW